VPVFSPAYARTGRVRRFMNLHIYACEGLIAIQDDRDGSFVAVTPAEFYQRIEQVKASAKRIGVPQTSALRDLLREYRRIIPELYEIIQEAKYMGDPSDPAVQAFWARHRRSTVFSMRVRPGSDPEGYPDLPELPRGRNTGRHAAADGILSPAVGQPQLPASRVRQLPKKRPRSGLVLLSDLL